MNENEKNLKYNAPNLQLGIFIDNSEEELVVAYDSTPDT